MPSLPSGLEIAVDPAPLQKLLLDYALPFNAHHVMMLRGIDDLFHWLDVLVLKPVDRLTADERAGECARCTRHCASGIARRSDRGTPR